MCIDSCIYFDVSVSYERRSNFNSRYLTCFSHSIILPSSMTFPLGAFGRLGHGMSTVYMLNSVGDIGEPCETPAVLVTVRDVWSSILTNMALLVMKLLTIWVRCGAVPVLPCLHTNALCHILSKALHLVLPLVNVVGVPACLICRDVAKLF